MTESALPRRERPPAGLGPIPAEHSLGPLPPTPAYPLDDPEPVSASRPLVADFPSAAGLGREPGFRSFDLPGPAAPAVPSGPPAPPAPGWQGASGAWPVPPAGSWDAPPPVADPPVPGGWFGDEA
ncbi:MAG: hypothetical protein QOD41_2884, partial [Cryptosporangiaceae bacterium]|nr:hypothetical protein [Cryptosporangiaceae bacterium]